MTEINNTNIELTLFVLCPEIGSISATCSAYKALDYTRLTGDIPLEAQESGQGQEGSTDKCRSRKCQAFRTEQLASQKSFFAGQPSNQGGLSDRTDQYAGTF